MVFSETLKEQLFDRKTLKETTRRPPNLSITSKLFSPRVTEVTDSVTLVTLNENITNLLPYDLNQSSLL